MQIVYNKNRNFSSGKTESRKMRRQIFTILELLIVISVISILAAILLPGLNSARKKAQSISCCANLKQISLACNMYVNDSNGYFPPRGTGTSQHLYLKEFYHYLYYRTVAPEENIWTFLPNPARGGKGSVFQCPAWREDNLAGMAATSVNPSLGYIGTTASAESQRGAFFLPHRGTNLNTLPRSAVRVLPGSVLFYDRKINSDIWLYHNYTLYTVLKNGQVEGPLARHPGLTANYLCFGGNVVTRRGAWSTTETSLPDPSGVDEEWCLK